MSQEFNIVFMIVAAIGGFLFFRNRGGDFPARDKILSILGVILILIGCFVVLLFNDKTVLIDCLLMRTFIVSGKLIFIGYTLVLMAALFSVDELIKEIKHKKGP
jgi:hypothetical protein